MYLMIDQTLNLLDDRIKYLFDGIPCAMSVSKAKDKKGRNSHAEMERKPLSKPLAHLSEVPGMGMK